MLLKQKTVAVNAKDSRGWTPLHCCVFSNANNKIISALSTYLIVFVVGISLIFQSPVAAGAEVNATTVDGTRPVDYFVRREPTDFKAYMETLEMLLHNSSINIKNLHR